MAHVKRTPPSRLKLTLPSAARDALLFLTGLALTIYVTVDKGAESPALLLLFAGMMGLPVVLRADEYRAGPKREETPEREA